MRRRRLFRSDSLDRLSPADQATLRELHVTTVLDLRTLLGVPDDLIVADYVLTRAPPTRCAGTARPCWRASRGHDRLPCRAPGGVRLLHRLRRVDRHGRRHRPPARGAAPPQHGDLGASVTARRLMSRTVTGLRLCGLGLLGIPGRASASEPVLVIEGRGSATAWACRRTGPGHGTAGADTATILQTFYPGTSSGHAGGSRCPGARRRQPGDRGRVPRRR